MDTVTGTGGGSIASTYYYAEDFLGSSRTMLQAGQTSPCFDADFLPFGREKDNVATCTQNDYKFEGKERDTETGNDDFGARYYSSNFGRWLSPDWSSIPEPVPYANLTNPQTLNLYAMVQDNPESFADLDGHVNTPSSANQWITCDVTDDQGCTEAQMGELSAIIRDPDKDHTPDALAGALNNDDLPGDPYALTFTPTVKVAICLKDVTLCEIRSSISRFGHHLNNLLHLHSWNHGMIDAGFGGFLPADPIPQVTAIADTAGLVGTALKSTPLGAVSAGASIANDRSRQNVFINLVGLAPGFEWSMGITGAFSDLFDYGINHDQPALQMTGKGYPVDESDPGNSSEKGLQYGPTGGGQPGPTYCQMTGDC